MPCPACAGESYAESMVELASRKELASKRNWDVLLFYRSVRGMRESIIDDQRFFLAADGKSNPASEMSATIAGFFAPDFLGDNHPLCRFPARYEWLKSELDLDPEKLPKPACAQLATALEAVDPRSAVLVFPSAHNNGPASMFGHTLLRVGSSYKSELLSYAINYAAHTTDTNGLVYAYKGLFGYYPGYFSILPYYEKVKEYNDLEHRDVWEYSLNLSQDETRRMVLHIWELQGISSEYYFFDENCSFMLLFLLEAARPELNLTNEYWDRIGFWVIPSDTITTVRKAGLINKVIYRPAQATRISHRASLLSQVARDRAFDVAMKRRSPADETLGKGPVEERRQVLDLAAEYVQYLYSRKDLEQDDFQRRFLQILRERSALGANETDPGRLPEPPQPEEGHRSARLSIGAGLRESDPFTEISWRPAYHDLLDPEAGYTKGAQINFMSVSGRFYPEKNSLVLQSLRPVDIVSLAPRDTFFKPVSWKVDGGLDRKTLGNGQDRLLLHLNTGGGLAWNLSGIGTVYGFAEADLNVSDRFRNKVALGGGCSAGLLGTISPKWTYHLKSRAIAYGIENHQQYTASLEQQYELNKYFGFSFNIGWERSFGYDSSEGRAGLAYYF